MYAYKMGKVEGPQRMAEITNKLVSLLEGAGLNITKVDKSEWQQNIYFNRDERVVISYYIVTNCIYIYHIYAWNPKTNSGITEICDMRFREGANPDYSTFVNECVDIFGA